MAHCYRSEDELITDVLLWTLAHKRASISQPSDTYISSVRTQGTTQKTYQKRWLIGIDGVRDSGNPLLSVYHDDSDDDDGDDENEKGNLF